MDLKTIEETASANYHDGKAGSVTLKRDDDGFVKVSFCGIYSCTVISGDMGGIVSIADDGVFADELDAIKIIITLLLDSN